ncbi:MAG TPA: type IX secretion system membrane protein PorP/SprF [Cyclobacteriaceae bacterium]|nr:type IX secretion system membrane protein PorP/SprF [Cyclobacteriaceae bacterium]
MRSPLAFILCVTIGTSLAQSPATNLYQYNYTSIAPTFAGQDGYKATVMGGALVPNAGRALISGLVGFEGKIDGIDSGVGFNASVLQTSTRTMSYYNLLYNYSLNVGKNKLIFGTTFGIHRETIHWDRYVALTPNDPLLNTPNKTIEQRLNVGLSTLFKTEKFFVGLSVDNLSRSNQFVGWLYEAYRTNSPQLKVITGIDTRIADWLSSSHSLYVINTDKYLWVDINNSFLIRNWLIMGLNCGFDPDGDFLPRVNTGVRIRNVAKIVASVYSEDYNRGSMKFQGQLMMVFSFSDHQQ